MVHKKSEYRLQYHRLTKELRKQIWQENIQFREIRRTVNQADHYWTYQVNNENCECDDDDDIDEAPLPRHRLKHKYLVDLYSRNTSKEAQIPTASIVHDQDNIIQRRHVDVPEHSTPYDYKREIGVQTPCWERKNIRLQENTSQGLQTQPENMSSLSVPALSIEHDDDDRLQSAPLTQHPSQVKFDDSTKSLQTQAAMLPGSHQPKDGQSSSESSPQCSRRCYSANPTPTRTKKKLFFEDKRSPFLPFGWNDMTRDVGSKKTFNVCAPETEVYPASLRAYKRRKAEIEQFLAEEDRRRRGASSTSSQSPINHSAIWMTEYQDKFSSGNKKAEIPERPSSAPGSTKALSWRYS